MAAPAGAGQAEPVLSDPRLGRPMYHLALAEEWGNAVERGEPYRRSTLGKSLDEVGFIHCSFASQVEMIADLVYRGRGDVLLLVIDPARVQAEVRVENLDGGEPLFPHIYGALPLDAVVRVDPLALSDDGRLTLGAPLTRD
jgi:glutathione S-transferase